MTVPVLERYVILQVLADPEGRFIPSSIHYTLSPRPLSKVPAPDRAVIVATAPRISNGLRRFPMRTEKRKGITLDRPEPQAPHIAGMRRACPTPWLYIGR